MTTKAKKRRSEPATYRDRIVGLVRVPATRLKRHPENWRLHPDVQRGALRGVLGEVGVAAAALTFIDDEEARQSMLALGPDERVAWLATYRGKLTVIDGHLRRDELRGQSIPVLVLDVSAQEARKLLASHDAITALAEVHAARWGKLAASAGFDDATTRAALESSLARYQTALPPLPDAPGSTAPDDDEEPIVPTDALVKKWGTAPGQLWVVPSLTVPGREHRILCGDCRKAEDVERVRGGRRPALGLHDGPYGINAVCSTGAVSANQRGNKPHKTAFAPIVDDDKPFEPAHLLASGARTLVLWGGNCFADKLPSSPEWVVWQKLADDAGESHFSSCELAWVSPPADRVGHVRRVVSLRELGVVDGDPRLHPTQKPIKVQRAPIEWYSAPGDDVEDWYMGAGGVIIACEQTGRIGHGIDIAHAYLAATLERLAVRGLKPRLVT